MRKTIVNLNEIVEIILARLSRLNTGYLVALCVGINLVMVAIFSMILFPGISNGLVFFSLTEELIVVAILAPIIETHIVQGFILKRTLLVSGDSKLIAIFVSALVFGMAHIYPNPPIAFKAFLSGLLYAILFFAINDKTKNPLFFVIIAHALYNLTVTFWNKFVL